MTDTIFPLFFGTKFPLKILPLWNIQLLKAVLSWFYGKPKNKNSRFLSFTDLPYGLFKEILGIDDRDDALSRYCLVTATYSIEQYCRRRLLISKQVEIHEYTGDLFVPLKQYPVQKILEVQKYRPWKPVEDIDPELFRYIPEYGVGEDILFARKFTRMWPCHLVRYRCGMWWGISPAMPRRTWLRLALNWQSGIWPVFEVADQEADKLSEINFL